MQFVEFVIRRLNRDEVEMVEALAQKERVHVARRAERVEERGVGAGHGRRGRERNQSQSRRSHTGGSPSLGCSTARKQRPQAPRNPRRVYLIEVQTATPFQGEAGS